MDSKIDFSFEAGLIWNTANDILRDIFKRTEYPDIIYPMVLIRRIENVLLQAREEVTHQYKTKISKLPAAEQKNIINDRVLKKIKFNNSSKFTLEKIVAEGERSIKNNFISYLNGYTDNIKLIIDRSGIRSHIPKLHSEKILYPLIKDFSLLPLGPDKVNNIKMGYIFEELVRRFSEANNEEAGEHYTPREVINLMVKLLDIDNEPIKDGQLITIYDPACGTGGMLTTTKEFIEEKLNPKANVILYGQEVNDKTWAICEADLLLKDVQAKISKGDTLTDDGALGEQFDFMLSNPPYGKSWKKIQKKVAANSNGRFDIGCPRSSDGQLLFTLQMISKMKPAELGGSAITIVHNGSPLFSGDAGSGESEIRRFIIENDWLEAIVALPPDLFYNTGISTYVWVIRNNKPEHRKGKIQLINAVDFYKPMKRSLGNKRKQIDDSQINEIIKIHKDFQVNQYSKIFDLEDFAFLKVFLDLEETDEDGNLVYEEKEISIPLNKLNSYFKLNTTEDEQNILLLKDKKEKNDIELKFIINPEGELIKKYNTPDTKIIINKYSGGPNGNSNSLKAKIRVPKIVKDTEYIPWKEDKEEFLKREVEKKWTITKEEKGYEIPFNKHFYIYQPLRNADEVIYEIAQLENENNVLLKQLGITL